MAYGTTAGVTVLVGGVDTVFFTTTNMSAAIVISDILVDAINSGASDNDKQVASDLIAAEIMKKGRITNKLKGLSSDGGVQGRPSRAAAYRDYIPKEAYTTLLSTKPGPSFKTLSPNSSGEWP